MTRRILAITTALSIAVAAVLALCLLVGRAALTEALTATLAPSVTAILPTGAPNDMDTMVVISCAHFQAGPTPPAVDLGEVLLGNPEWGSPRPTALGTSTDGERTTVYVGSTGAWLRR